jgi:hypothetical protein
MVIRDVKHRWNYTEAMISRALVLRKVYSHSTLDKPIEAMISRVLVLRKVHSHSTLDKPILIIAPQAIQRWVLKRDELHPLVLSDDHWKLLKALREILKVRVTAPFVSLLTSFSDSF